MTNNIPYTYLIGWSKEDIWYYGVRYSKNCNPSDFWVTYFTSSKKVKERRLTHGEPDVIQIRRVFENKIKARWWEDTVHRRMNVVKSNRWLNGNYGNSKFDTTGHFAGITRSGETIFIKSDDPLVLSGEVRSRLSGKSMVKDKQGNVVALDKDDERIKTGEFVSIAKHTAMAYDSIDKTPIGRISLDDPRWKTGEIIGSLVFSQKMATNIGMIDRNDPRIISKEIHHVNHNTCLAKETSTNKVLGRISLDDPRWKTGEIVGWSKDKCAAKLKETFQPIGNIDKSDPRWKTGEIVPLAYGTAMAKHPTTGIHIGRIPTTDPRWKTGQIVGIKKKIKNSPNLE